MEQIILECKKVTFYSQIDETQFFDWLDRVESIVDIRGMGDSIKLMVEEPISDDGLRELLSVFHRYKVEKKQLRQFETNSNRHWFAKNVNAYWHKDVFA